MRVSAGSVLPEVEKLLYIIVIFYPTSIKIKNTLGNRLLKLSQLHYKTTVLTFQHEFQWKYIICLIILNRHIISGFDFGRSPHIQRIHHHLSTTAIHLVLPK